MSSLASCMRCNMPYDVCSGRHMHNNSNLCNDLMINQFISIKRMFKYQAINEFGRIAQDKELRA